MTTRNQLRRANANSSVKSSKTDGVDFESIPIVALPAANSSSFSTGIDEKATNNLNSYGNRSDLEKNASSSPSRLKFQGGPSSSTAEPATPLPAVAATNTPKRSETSNPVLIAVLALRSGELTVVPERVARQFGVRAGPVANLDFSDPKVAELLMIPVQKSPAAASIVTASSGSVLVNSDSVNSALVNPVPAVNSAASNINGIGPLISNIVANDALLSYENTIPQALNVNDPKVADFTDTVPVLQASVLESRTEIDAPVPISSLETTQNLACTVSSSLVVPLLHNKSPPAAAVVGPSVIAGHSARPNKAVENLNNTSNPNPPVASWAGLFKANRALTDDTKMEPNFVGVTLDDVDVDVELIDSDLEDECEEKRSLIGFFNGKFPGINAIQRIVDDWSRKCTFHIHNSGWLVFEFDEEEDCDVVMKEGPYFAFNKPLVLKKMPEYFDFSDEAYSTAPVWIQLPNLPLRAWKKSALEKICTFIGTPLYMDQVTKDKTQKSFARCLVEVDVSKELPSLVICKLPRGKVIRQHVLYEETPTFCANCKKLGHETDDCYSKNNGKPSLYFSKSKKDKEKKIGNKQGMARGTEKGAAKAAGHVPSLAKAAVAVPVDANIPVKALDKNLGPVSRPNVAAGSLNKGPITRQSTPTSKEPVLSKNNGINAKESGFVSTNAFEPLANEKVGNWADDVETSNAMEKNNNKKKNNGKKK